MPTDANKAKVLIFNDFIFKNSPFLLAFVGSCWSLLALLARWQGKKPQKVKKRPSKKKYFFLIRMVRMGFKNKLKTINYEENYHGCGSHYPNSHRQLSRL